MSRDRFFALLSAIVVGLVIVLGAFEIGSPRQQRAAAADEKRVSQMREIVQRLYGRGAAPENLSQVGSWVDPERQTEYEYRRTTATNYQLCAVFNEAFNDPNNANWNHPQGHYCYDFTTATFR